jgi:hypothetical protein
MWAQPPIPIPPEIAKRGGEADVYVQGPRLLAPLHLRGPVRAQVCAHVSQDIWRSARTGHGSSAIPSIRFRLIPSLASCQTKKRRRCAPAIYAV